MTQSSDSTPTPRVVVFADDLTGANDAGAQIAKRGIETVSLLEPGLARELHSPALVFDTESRGLCPEDAREAVRRAARRVTLEGAEIVYKKIDSTLRGNVGAEIAALIEQLDPDAVVRAPPSP